MCQGGKVTYGYKDFQKRLDTENVVEDAPAQEWSGALPVEYSLPSPHHVDQNSSECSYTGEIGLIWRAIGRRSLVGPRKLRHSLQWESLGQWGHVARLWVLSHGKNEIGYRYGTYTFFFLRT